LWEQRRPPGTRPSRGGVIDSAKVENESLAGTDISDASLGTGEAQLDLGHRSGSRPRLAAQGERVVLVLTRR
jgi:hypothetical protein